MEKVVTQIEGVKVEELLSMFRDALRDISPTPTTQVIDESKPLTIEGAAAFTGLKKQTIYNLTSEDKIPFHKRGGKIWFFRSELIAWIRGELETA